MTKQVAIITAASKGMGKACARAFHEQGYEVVLMARSESIFDLAEQLSGEAMQGSVDEANDLDELVKMAIDRFGRIDVVVNNTGHPPKGELLSLTDQDWHSGNDLVLMNVIRMARLVTPIMQGQEGGSFINISTFAAYEPSLKFPVSSAMRAALGAYTKMYAQAYGPDNIRMNNILPGYIESYPITEETKKEIPLKRSGSLDEIARTAVFLASDAAAYITGENLKVDGGLSKHV